MKKMILPLFLAISCLSFSTDLIMNVEGELVHEYKFSLESLKNYPLTTVRTLEVSEKGEYLGAYEYTGVAFRQLLENIKVKKNKTAAFDRELDMVVTVIGQNGKKAYFSYGELYMQKDCYQTMIAFNRKAINPAKPVNYKKNKKIERKTGFFLVCTGDYNTHRYIEDVKEIKIKTLKAPNKLLPVMKKGTHCSSEKLNIVINNSEKRFLYKEFKPTVINNWIRIGHGRGFKNIANLKGIKLKDVLLKNYSNYTKGYFFLLVGCDGYRSIFSSDEIFNSPAGECIYISDRKINKMVKGNIGLVVTSDYFIDRCIWGLASLAVINEQN